MVTFKGAHFEVTVILTCVRWYLVEQDHRAIKRVTRPVLGFKAFWTAQRTLAGIEVMHMIKKGHLVQHGEQARTPADQFYSLAA